jgi:hypothetical protein
LGAWFGAYKIQKTRKIHMKREPLLTTAAITAVVSALLAVLVSFGLGIDPGQQQALLGFVTVVAPFVIALVARKRVTPVSDPKDENGSPLAPESDAGEPYEDDGTELVADAEETA